MRPKRRNIPTCRRVLITASVLLLPLFGPLNALAQRANILWIDVEDLSPDLGCYGNEVVHTPNIDRLARQGIRFTQSFAVNPICSPNRSAIITGMYPTTLGAHNHRSTVKLPDRVRLVTELLREAGYFICGSPKNDYNFDRTPEFHGEHWDARQDGQPFFAQVHFGVTHRKFKNDPKHPIDPSEVDLPPYYPDRPLTRMDWARYLETIQILDRRVGSLLQDLKEDNLTRSTVVFFTSDHGRAMPRGKEWLYEGGIRVPLIVRWPTRLKGGQVSGQFIASIDLAPTWLKIGGVETPDWMQGRPFLGWRRQPRRYIVAARDRAGSTVDRIRAIRTDRYKYIRNYYPKRPYLQFNEYKMRQYPTVALIEWLQKKGKLGEDVKPFAAPRKAKEELYDLDRDPYEVNNLADDPQVRGVLARMRKRLDKWMGRTDDKGRCPELPALVNSKVRGDVEQFSEAMQERGLSADLPLPRYLAWWRDEIGVTEESVQKADLSQMTRGKLGLEGDGHYRGRSYRYCGDGPIRLELIGLLDQARGLRLLWGAKDDARSAMVYLNGYEEKVVHGGYDGYRWVELSISEDQLDDGVVELRIEQQGGNYAPAFVAALEMIPGPK